MNHTQKSSLSLTLEEKKSPLPIIVFILGPTASGKSAVALHLAEKFQGAIFNCDSIQLYEGLNIGAAKPTVEEFKRAPHFLFNIGHYPQVLTAGDYRRVFLKTLDEQAKNFKIIFVVGGTGFYFQAIEKGMFQSGKADPKVLETLQTELHAEGGQERLYQELLKNDPESAHWIHPNDHYRLLRALGVWRTEGHTISQLKNQKVQQTKDHSESLVGLGYPLIKIGTQLPKEILEKRITERTELMLEGGFESEVNDLLKKCDPQWAPLQSVGYREMIQFLLNKNKDQSYQQLKKEIVISTRQLAKKQRTWFQRDPEIHWVDMTQKFDQVVQQIENQIEHQILKGKNI